MLTQQVEVHGCVMGTVQFLWCTCIISERVQPPLRTDLVECGLCESCDRSCDEYDWLPIEWHSYLMWLVTSQQTVDTNLYVNTP